MSNNSQFLDGTATKMVVPLSEMGRRTGEVCRDLGVESELVSDTLNFGCFRDSQVELLS